MPPLENCYVCSKHFSAESFGSQFTCADHWSKVQTETEKGCRTIGVLLSSIGEEAEAVKQKSSSTPKP